MIIKNLANQLVEYKPPTSEKFICQRCEGEGSITLKCDECGGSGVVEEECFHCGGSGESDEKIECKECSGEGFIERTSPQFRIIEMSVTKTIKILPSEMKQYG